MFIKPSVFLTPSEIKTPRAIQTRQATQMSGLIFTPRRRQSGFTLIELVVFIVVVSVALGGFIKVISAATANSVDPIFKVTALQKAQSQLDAILARKFDESTPVGGIPACNTSLGVACTGITADADFDDVGDFNGFSQTDNAYTTTVSVVNAGSQLGIANDAARLITVSVTLPTGDSVSLSAYKVNF